MKQAEKDVVHIFEDIDKQTELVTRAVEGSKKAQDEIIKQAMKILGKKGGTKRAENHSKEQLSKWAKLGGRPKQNHPHPSTEPRGDLN